MANEQTIIIPGSGTETVVVNPDPTSFVYTGHTSGTSGTSGSSGTSGQDGTLYNGTSTN